MREWSGSGGSEDEDGPDLQRAVVMDDDEEVDQTKILFVAEISLGLCPEEEAGNTVECVPPLS